MSIIVNCLLTTLFFVMVIDIARFMDSVKYGIWKWVLGKRGNWENIELKPFDCSLCSSFWANVIYLFYVDHLTILNVTVVMFFSVLTPIFQDLIWTIRDLLGKIISIMNKL